MTVSMQNGQPTVLPWEQVSNKRGTHRGQDTWDMVRKTRTPNRHNTGNGKHSGWDAKHAGDWAVSQPPCLHALAIPRSCTPRHVQRGVPWAGCNVHQGRRQSTDEDGEECRWVHAHSHLHLGDGRHRATEHKQALVHEPEQALAEERESSSVDCCW